MSTLQVFSNVEFGEVRTIVLEDGKIFFCGIDVAKALGYADPNKAIKRHTKGWTFHPVLTKGGTQEMIFISESDIYRLIIRSKLASAERFERWVFEEVLPSIRKYGGYITKEKLEDIFENPYHLNLFLKQMVELSEENLHLKSKVEELKPKAEYYEHMMSSEYGMNFRTTAKEIGIKPMYFVTYLLDRKYLYRNNRKELLPYQHHMEDGLFVIIEYLGKSGHVGVQTLVTPKGREHFMRLYIDGVFQQGSI